MNTTRHKLILLLAFVCLLVLIQQRWRLALLLDPIDVQAVDASQVVLYATHWCGYCAQARRFFERADIPYTEKDIERSAQARAEFDALGGRGVPLILVGDERLHGFEPGKLRAALERLNADSP